MSQQVVSVNMFPDDPTPVNVRTFIEAHKPLVQLLRNNNQQGYRTEYNNIQNRMTEAVWQNTMNELAILLINYPIIYMKCLLTLVFWETMGSKTITPNIKLLFVHFDVLDNQNLERTGFVYNQLQTQDVSALRSAASTWYENVVKQWLAPSIDVEDQIHLMKRIIDLVLQEGLGNRAYLACKNAAFTASLTSFATFSGCLNNLVPEAECVDIRRAVNNLLKACVDISNVGDHRVVA
jgi:hypothetical protein